MANPQRQTQPPPTNVQRTLQSEDDVEIDVKDLDPETMITLEVMDRHNAGKSPSSRWGKVVFDEIGIATIKVPLKDVHIVHQLKWLSPEDQAKYLGLEEAQPASPAEAKATAEIEALRGANIKLASRNADLEAQMDEMARKYKTEFKAFQEGTNKEIEALRAKVAEAENALKVATAAKKNK